MRKLAVFLIFTLFFAGAVASAYCQEPVSCQECIAFYGDSQSGHEIHKQIVADIMKLDPKIVFHLGDMVARGYKQKDWDRFNEITKELRQAREFFPVIGNHEKESPLYFKNFSLPKDKPWYSVERFGMHFIVLDTNLPLDWWSKQHRWLKNELERLSRDNKPIIVLMHKPLFSIAYYSKEAKPLRQKVVHLLEKYGVAVVFSGDDHNYQRAMRNNIYYVVTGGGGGGLYSKVSSDPETQKYNQKFLVAHNFCTLSFVDGVITVKAYDIDLNPIDEFSFKVREAGN